MSNRLIEVRNLGQSLWYDYISRDLITSGGLRALVEADGILGVTSNPAIFEKAVAGSNDYDQAIRALVQQGVATANDIYERLAIADIQLAADILYPAFVRSEGRDGYVSLEVSPYLAHDTVATVEEAHRLRRAVGRDNVLIKVPATAAGIPAIEQLIGDGVNVNVTLLFALSAYEAVAEAYIRGVEKRAADGGDLRQVASVASFFISRIDSFVDDKLAKRIEASAGEQRKSLQGLLGKTAIANAKNTYARYLDLYASPRWQRLAAQGARPQRLLWASTSTKNPSYPKTIYVDELIGADTVNTVPAETLTTFHAQGEARARLTESWPENLRQARTTLAALEEHGVHLSEATDYLLQDGVEKFSDAFDKLLAAVERKRCHALQGRLATQSFEVGEATAVVQAALEAWRRDGKVRRLWAGDTSLWSGADEDRWLGWLRVLDGDAGDGEEAARLQQLVEEVRAEGIRYVVVLGMGGSSLCPDVLRQTFGARAGFPELVVLDSTVPAQVLACAQRVDLSKTLCVVSSKSGGTIEPNVFKEFFFDRIQQATGAAGRHFVAITDPGTKMEEVAKADGFRAIFYGLPSIGGRYSALSAFGMVPAALMGMDLSALRERTRLMVGACDCMVPPESNPGVMLGLVLATLAQRGRDKITLVLSPPLRSLASWVEQLVAESTGKQGVGLVPIADEDLAAATAYGSDRQFVYVRLASAPSAEQDDAVQALEKAGQPVVRIELNEVMEIGQEFFRWEMATAVAGAVLGINPFDQPDVEASKVETRKLTSAFESGAPLPKQEPVLTGDGVSLCADPSNAEALRGIAASLTVGAYFKAHLGRVAPGDYVALNAYVEMNPANERELQALRHLIRDRFQVATTVGFGPRFLHSTGQLHKGGANNGIFIQITSDDAKDVAIPGRKYSFGMLKQAQAQGDLEVLAQRRRRLLRVHLGADVEAGLRTLREMLAE